MGCGVAGEATAALRVLGRLAAEHTRALLQYAAFLSSVLDHLDTLSSSQLHQVVAFDDHVPHYLPLLDS